MRRHCLIACAFFRTPRSACSRSAHVTCQGSGRHIPNRASGAAAGSGTRATAYSSQVYYDLNIVYEYFQKLSIFRMALRLPVEKAGLAPWTNGQRSKT